MGDTIVLTELSSPLMLAKSRSGEPMTDHARTSRDPVARIAPLVVLLFFAWGFATVLIDSLIPKLKALFTLSYAEVMLTQFSFFLAYFLCSIPAGWVLARIGYLRAIVTGLLVMAAGCVLFIPAVDYGVFGGFLVALFVMAAGITLLQVAANPLIAVLGSPETSHSRLNLAQAFNSLGTFVGPFVGAAFILGGSGEQPVVDIGSLSADALATYRHAEAEAVQGPFLGIAAGLVVLVVIFWSLRRLQGPSLVVQPASSGLVLGVLRDPRLAFGALSIFAYVGAEVSIGSLLTNYLMQPSTLGLTPAKAGTLVSLYWGGAMVGRFIGSAVLRRVPAGAVLAACALGAALLASISALSAGMVAAVTVIAIGLCNSIMFPTIFTLAIERLGARTPQGSAMLCLAIVGGAIVPVVTGLVADRSSLAIALFVPAVCYLWIAAYGVLTRMGVVDRAGAGDALDLPKAAA